MPSITPEVLEKLRAYDTPTICNVIELFDVRPRTSGFMDARIRACFPEMPPVVGFAATATFRASAPPLGMDIYGSLDVQVERFSELSGPPIVVFQDLDDPAVAATFGEIMCTTYQTFGSVGLITSGAGRDLDQVRKIGYPVFTGGTISAHGYCHIPDIHVPVRVGGLVVNPDDLLHMDVNGVTSIPKEIAAQVADACEAYVASEMMTLNALHAYGQDQDIEKVRAAKKEAKRQVAELRERVGKSIL